MNKIIQNDTEEKNFDESEHFATFKNFNLNVLNNENNTNIIEAKNTFSISDLSKYKSTKLLGINFYHVGNTYVFGFINGFSHPLFCIDNMWYLHFIIYFIEIIIYYIGNYYFYSKLEHWKQFTFNILLITFFIFYSILILINPGIILKSTKDYKHTGFCPKCNLYFIPLENINHCPYCNICVKKLDHHCHAIRKCITKNNMILFILMVANFILLYLFSLINFIIFIFNYYYYKNKKI